MEESLRVGLKIKLPLVRHVMLGRPRLDLPVSRVVCPLGIFLEIGFLMLRLPTVTISTTFDLKSTGSSGDHPCLMVR